MALHSTRGVGSDQRRDQRGYALTGNISDICPECGTPVAKELADKGPRRA